MTAANRKAGQDGGHLGPAVPPGGATRGTAVRKPTRRLPAVIVALAAATATLPIGGTASAAGPPGTTAPDPGETRTASPTGWRSAYNNRCVDADLDTIGGNGTKVQFWNCNGQPQQRFY